MLAALLTAALTAALALGASMWARATAEKQRQKRASAMEDPGGASPGPDEEEPSPGRAPVFQRPSDAGAAFFALLLLAGFAAGVRVPLWTGGLALLTIALLARPKDVHSSAWLTLPLFLAACSVGVRYSTWDARQVLVAQASLGPALTSGAGVAVASTVLTAVACLVIGALWGMGFSNAGESTLDRWAVAGLSAAPALAVAPLGGPGLLAVVAGPPRAWPYAVLSVMLIGVVAAVSAAAGVLYVRPIARRSVTLLSAFACIAIALGWLV